MHDNEDRCDNDLLSPDKSIENKQTCWDLILQICYVFLNQHQMGGSMRRNGLWASKLDYLI